MCTTLEMKVVFSSLMCKLMLFRYINCLLVYVSKSLMVDFSLFKCVYACGVCVYVQVTVAQRLLSMHEIFGTILSSNGTICIIMERVES